MKMDVTIRAFKTFWQSSIAYLVATFSTEMMGVVTISIIDVYMSLTTLSLLAQYFTS